ncbi:MAG: hypothetical protein B6245_05585 [Desulfobacteraceae bacterium 4572_88]|nr:MAG: hypothetical protein B6245_05585 [Desulfobacteraceae bacterium 4572_88]RLC09305.1 MAG: hybrid sensor histidine kinase/response regulator [Deltaproteobacteria bacterium]
MSSEDRKKSNILIVDDVPKNIQLAGSILQKEKHNIFFANNGVNALRLIKKNKFDLILLDIMMPEMDGFEICEKLKASPETSDIPVIFLTAKSDNESTIKGFEAGAVDYVTKPFNEKELLARVRTHLELRQTQASLQEANVTKDKFFSIIAHDLKNPFNSLLVLSKLLLNNFDGFDDEKKKEFIQVIYDTSDHGRNLLENLLDWSRMQIGRFKWQPDKIDLFTYGFENVSLLKACAENKKISLESEIEKGSMVYADPNMTRMIIRNLMSNALKFTSEGGYVKVSAKMLDNEAVVTVSDNGLGIKEENIRKLFKIDTHHSTPGTADERGTGLGLILCKEFVDKNGGKIWIESEFQKGSDFKFTLPREA